MSDLHLHAKEANKRHKATMLTTLQAVSLRPDIEEKKVQGKMKGWDICVSLLCDPTEKFRPY